MSSEDYINVNGADWTLRFDTSIGLNSTKSLDKALAKISGVLDEKQIKKQFAMPKRLPLEQEKNSQQRFLGKNILLRNLKLKTA